jgi:DNA-binding beta-propeller fold protein YncE
MLRGLQQLGGPVTATILRKTALFLLLSSMALVWISCGDVFRPVANPIPGPIPDPQNFHFAIVVSQNAPANPGTGMQIDVSGDTNVGVANTATAPVHAALLPPNGNRVYVANGTSDSMSVFAPASVTSSIGTVTTISLPPGSNPVFVHSTENATMYVADFGANNVAAIVTTSNVVSQFIPVGANPRVLAETPNAQKLYSVNAGTLTSINPVNKSVNSTFAIPGFPTPTWAVASVDNASLYVLDQNNGLVVLKTFDDSVLGSPATQVPGGDFLLLDRHLNRLYTVTHTAAQNSVSILDATSPIPTFIKTIDLTATVPTLGVAPCPAGCQTVMVTALQDGTRAYALSYTQTATTLNSSLTVIRTSDNTVTKVIDLGTVDLTTLPVSPAPGALAACQSPSVRFPLSITSSGDSSRIYVANCFAGSTAVIRSSDDTLVLPLQAPVSAYTPVSGQQPPPQNPVWVVAGP